MILQNSFDPIETSKLFGYDKNFDFLNKMLVKKIFPSVLMLSGKKGIGKSTFISHFLHFYFDKIHYDYNKKAYLVKSNFHKQFRENIFPNIFYLNSSKQKINIEEIRNLKIKLSKSSINKNKRFVIIDEIETLNINCLNALLKIIEEPGTNDHFILINNKNKFLLETIKSRALELKIFLKKKINIDITKSLIDYFNQDILFDYNLVKTSPGNFIKYNHLFKEKKIDITDDFLKNFIKILNHYKKEKNSFFKDLLIFYTDYHLQNNLSKLSTDSTNLIEKRYFIIKKINDYFLYNLNQNTLINSIENKFSNE